MSTSVQRAGHSNLIIGGIAALAIIALAVTLGVGYKEIHDNNDAISRIDQERIARNAQVHAEIRQLACILVSQTPDDPKRPIIHEFRVKYGCPPYSKKNAKRALQGHPVTRSVQQPAPTVTRTVTVPGPTVTRTVTVPPGRTGRHHDGHSHSHPHRAQPAVHRRPRHQHVLKGKP